MVEDCEDQLGRDDWESLRRVWAAGRDSHDGQEGNCGLDGWCSGGAHRHSFFLSLLVFYQHGASAPPQLRGRLAWPCSLLWQWDVSRCDGSHSEQAFCKGVCVCGLSLFSSAAVAVARFGWLHLPGSLTKGMQSKAPANLPPSMRKKPLLLKLSPEIWGSLLLPHSIAYLWLIQRRVSLLILLPRLFFDWGIISIQHYISVLHNDWLFVNIVGASTTVNLADHSYNFFLWTEL